MRGTIYSCFILKYLIKFVLVKRFTIFGMLNKITYDMKIIYILSGKLIFVSMIISFLLCFAQTRGQDAGQSFEIHGTVTNSETGEPLPGVSVVEKGSQNGVITDFEGVYSISIKANDNVTLVFAYMGFESKEVVVVGKNTLNVSLESDISTLDELIVVGYTTQKDRTITGAISSVSADDIEARRVPNVTQALQGNVAGVNITQSTGAPGDDIEVRIRGNGTIGNNNPLYVVDGVPTREITFLNPSDIKSMTVLKDASAAAIYGSRAAGGVIVIETKGGEEGGGLNIDYYMGFQKVQNLPKMLNAHQYLDVVEQAWWNAGREGSNPYEGEKNRTDLADINYLDELFELGKTHNLQVSASGGNDKTRYFIAGGFFNQNGPVVYDNDKYQRINFRTNVSSDLNDRFKVGSNLQLSYEYKDRISSKGDTPGIIRHAFLRPPIIPVYKDKDDPYYSERDPFTDLPFYRGPDNYEDDKYQLSQNPIALAYFSDNALKTYKMFGNVFAEYSFLEDKTLLFRSNLGADVKFMHSKAFGLNFGDDDGGGADQDKGLGRQNRPTSLSEERGQDITITWSNSLSYNKEIEEHAINALVGSEYIVSRLSNLNASRTRFDFTQPEFRYMDFGDTEQDIWNGGLAEEWKLFSIFSSATYSYKKRYMITANLRADASSRFAKDREWGFFPSMSAGWMVSEEPFAKDIDWLSQLKLRGSWGQLGNQEIPNYAFLTLYQRDQNRYVIDRYGNSDLKWETTTQINFGLDFELWRNQLFGSLDYFQKKTSDILLPISLPQFVGDVSPTYLNAGEVSNKGVEFQLGYKNYNREFKYKVSGNFATLLNEVKSLHPNLPYISGDVTRTQPGHPLNAYYGFVQEGVYQNQQEVGDHLFGTENPPQKPGDIKFKDLNGDGKINDKDRTFIGNPNPRFSYGINFEFNYKGFDFKALFQGVEGVERYNDLKKILDYDTRPFNSTTAVLNAWNGEGSSNTIPRVSASDNGGSRISNIFVEDASYFRLKNLELGYSFNLNKGIGVKNLRLYLSGQNIFTITDYSGLDPESTDLMDFGTYPQSLTILAGINLSL